MQTREKRTFKNQLYEQFARIGKALASPHRLELLDVLAQCERTVEALAQDVPDGYIPPVPLPQRTSQRVQFYLEWSLQETCHKRVHQQAKQHEAPREQKVMRL